MRTEPVYKRPESVLVLLHDAKGRVLLLERADAAGFWQSVTGSLEEGESPFQAALRELAEETGLTVPPQQMRDWHTRIVYEIFPRWRHRYAPGTTENTEHWFSYCLPEHSRVRLSPREHTDQVWLDAQSAAEKVFSPSNRDLILRWHAGQGPAG